MENTHCPTKFFVIFYALGNVLKIFLCFRFKSIFVSRTPFAVTMTTKQHVYNIHATLYNKHTLIHISFLLNLILNTSENQNLWHRPILIFSLLKLLLHFLTILKLVKTIFASIL